MRVRTVDLAMFADGIVMPPSGRVVPTRSLPGQPGMPPSGRSRDVPRMPPSVPFIPVPAPKPGDMDDRGQPIMAPPLMRPRISPRDWRSLINFGYTW